MSRRACGPYRSMRARARVMASSADLGGSGTHSSDILEGRSAEYFHANIDWA